MHVSEAKRLKALEAENAKLKKLLAEQPMNASTLKGYRQRRACGLVGINPRVYRQLPTRSEDADLRARLKALSSEQRRFGYRRLHMLLRREGWQVNWSADMRGYPCMAVVHKGTERTSNAILKWQEGRKVEGPPKPQQSYLMNEVSLGNRSHPKNLRAD